MLGYDVAEVRDAVERSRQRRRSTLDPVLIRAIELAEDRPGCRAIEAKGSHQLGTEANETALPRRPHRPPRNQVLAIAAATTAARSRRLGDRNGLGRCRLKPVR